VVTAALAQIAKQNVIPLGLFLFLKSLHISKEIVFEHKTFWMLVKRVNIFSDFPPGISSTLLFI